MARTDDGTERRLDYDVVIVGGGPAGCAAGVFTARYGLETAIFDRGRSSLRRCAHLENYRGFPSGIDIGTFYELLHDHAETAGCELVSDLVESVDRREGAVGFTASTDEDRRVSARRAIAATRYGTIGRSRGRRPPTGRRSPRALPRCLPLRLEHARSERATGLYQ